MSDVFQWSDTPSTFSLPSDELLHRVVEGIATGRPAYIMSGHRVSEKALVEPPGFDVLVRAEGSTSVRLLLQSGGTFVSLGHDAASKNYDITVYGGSRESVLAAYNAIMGELPSIAIDDETIFVNFWSLGRNGAVNRTRRISTNSWPDISRNYSAGCRSAVDQLLAWEPGEDGGRLLVLHGVPGTGKTHAIRALSHEWRHWCSVHYVVDCEQFFGNADYMLSVLLQSDESEEFGLLPTDIMGSVEAHPSSARAPQWRLIVIEDADEMLKADAKQVAGQNLSRLLNLCDGMIGQGLRVLVLLTTNEKIGSIHEAVIRPGRCIAEIEFTKLSRAEATEWAGCSTESATIAELFEQRQHEQVRAHAGAVETGAYL